MRVYSRCDSRVSRPVEALSTYAGKPLSSVRVLCLSPAFQRERMCNQTALGINRGPSIVWGVAPSHVTRHAGGIRERRSSFPSAQHAQGHRHAAADRMV